MRNNKNFTVQIKVDSIVSININAPSLEEGLAEIREGLPKIQLFADDVEVIDTNEEITGIY